MKEDRDHAGTITLLWLVPAAGYYGLLLTAGSDGLFAPVPNGLTFNSMLLHLLHGRFDVDPTAIGAEGFLRDGAVYAYFGILPALVRAAVLYVPNFALIDFTRVCCLVAVTTMAFFKVLSVRLIWQRASARPSLIVFVLFIVAILISGPQIQFLRPSIYQEVELWSGALSAIFVYIVLGALTANEGFTSRALGLMAGIAGLCLLTRVSTAIGLYLAVGFVWICLAWRQVKEDSYRLSTARFVSLSLPIAILVFFVGVTAVINAARWGNPAVFADFTRALILPQYPDRLARLQHYGEFNLARLGYGLGYYFLPLWAFRDGAGQLIWSSFEGGFTECCVELPPSSFFVSDPLIIGLAIYGLVNSMRNEAPQRAFVAAAAGGLFVPVLLMLTAVSMTFRYRMEFYPFFDLFAFLGFARVLELRTSRVLALLGTATFAGVVTAHGMWLLYMLSPFGPAGSRLGSLPIGAFYHSLY